MVPQQHAPMDNRYAPRNDVNMQGGSNLVPIVEQTMSPYHHDVAPPGTSNEPPPPGFENEVLDRFDGNKEAPNDWEKNQPPAAEQFDSHHHTPDKKRSTPEPNPSAPRGFSGSNFATDFLILITILTYSQYK